MIRALGIIEREKKETIDELGKESGGVSREGRWGRI
jgi:hypothetical protein